MAFQFRDIPRYDIQTEATPFLNKGESLH